MVIARNILYRTEEIMMLVSGKYVTSCQKVFILLANQKNKRLARYHIKYRVCSALENEITYFNKQAVRLD